MSARAEPRFTRDVDVAVIVDGDAAAEQLVRSLTADGYGLGALVEQDAVGRLATVRLISPGANSVGVVVDLIFATAGIEAEIVAEAEVLEILPGVSMPVATAGHLVALKLLARDDETRPQDAADLLALASVLPGRLSRRCRGLTAAAIQLRTALDGTRRIADRLRMAMIAGLDVR